MNHTHILPIDGVELNGFFRINHSPVSDVYLATSEISLECKPNDILSLKLIFSTVHGIYGAAYTTRRNMEKPPTDLFRLNGDLLVVLHHLIKDLPDGVNLYLFRYQDKTSQVTELPRGCPRPPEFDGQKPNSSPS